MMRRDLKRRKKNRNRHEKDYYKYIYVTEEVMEGW